MTVILALWALGAALWLIVIAGHWRGMEDTPTRGAAAAAALLWPFVVLLLGAVAAFEAWRSLGGR